MDKVRMRVGVFIDPNANIYCLDCNRLSKPHGSYGLQTVVAESAIAFLRLMKESADMFFCVCCAKFLYSDVLHYSSHNWTAHLRSEYPTCDRHIVTHALNDCDAYVTLYASYHSRPSAETRAALNE